MVSKHAGSLLELIQGADSTASAQMMRIAQEQLQQGSWQDDAQLQGKMVLTNEPGSLSGRAKCRFIANALMMLAFLRASTDKLLSRR